MGPSILNSAWPRELTHLASLKLLLALRLGRRHAALADGDRADASSGIAAAIRALRRHRVYARAARSRALRSHADMITADHFGVRRRGAVAVAVVRLAAGDAEDGTDRRLARVVVGGHAHRHI